MRWIGWMAGGLAGLIVAALIFQVVSLRTGWEPGVSVVRRFTRLMNPRQMKTAGQPGAYAAVIRHVGRRSGQRYETPVGVVETDLGLVVALPYGTSPDWLKNVLAAGSAELVYEGETFPVVRPEVVPSGETGAQPSQVDRFLQRLYGVDQSLLLARADTRARSLNR